MNKNKKAILIVLVFIGLIIIISISISIMWIPLVDFLAGYDRELAHEMESIKKGMTKDYVVNLLGPPLSLQDGPIKKTECLYYENGIDSWGKYCIDEKDMVYFVEYVGGT